tara:strand:+ start:6241 stop:6789 length:549 start_codon:yes stop_codon:yes gene_type:complete
MSQELVGVDQATVLAHAEAASEWQWAVENTYKIKNIQEYEHGAALLAQNKVMANTIINDFKPAKSKAHDTHKTICGTEKKHLKPLLEAEKHIKAEMVRFKDEQDKIDMKKGAFVATIPELDSIEIRKSWDFEVENELELPREFLTVDAKALKDHVSKHKDSVPIKGVRFFQKTTLAVKGCKE